ncbi:putative sterigmatocystin biosynthesis dehydrogenase stcV, partial [Colletotrichum shisoi]
MEAEIIPMCEDQGMAVVSWASLGGGQLLTSEQGEKLEKDPDARPNAYGNTPIALRNTLESLAKKKGTSLQAISIYVFPIAGVNNVAHVEAMPDAVGVELSKEDVDLIHEASPFDPGFPMDFLFSRYKAQKYDLSLTAADNQQYRLSAWIDAPPKPSPYKPRKIGHETESICLDDRSGHVSCKMTMGGPFSIDSDLAHFFLPYGTVAWISNIIGLWIWIALMNGKTPLNLNREIKHTTLVPFGTIAWTVFVGVSAILKVPKMESRDLKIIAICRVVVAVMIYGPTLCLMRKTPVGHEQPKAAEEQTGQDKDKIPEESAETIDENVGSRCHSSDSVRSTPSISSTVVSASEKTGFLDSITSRVPGAQRTDTKPSTEEEDTDTSKKVFASRQVTDVRQQREVRDTLILFGVFLGIAVVAGILGLASSLNADSKQSEDEESVDREEEREKKKPEEAKKIKEAVLLGVLVLGGIL